MRGASDAVSLPKNLWNLNPIRNTLVEAEEFGHAHIVLRLKEVASPRDQEFSARVDALQFIVGVEALDDFRSDGRIGSVAIQVYPHYLLVERDRGAARARNTLTPQMEHGVLQ